MMRYKNFIRRVDVALNQSTQKNTITLDKDALNYGITHGFIQEINGTMNYNGVEVK